MASVTSPKATDFHLGLYGDLHRWRVFVAIAELGSLSRAALYLNSDQSLLSRQLNALERDCGARLFNRTGRGVDLSDFGAAMLPKVRPLLTEACRLDTEIRERAREPAGIVTLGTIPSIGGILIGELFSALRRQYPAVSLKVFEGSSGQVEEWLTDARVDIAILYRYGSALPEGEEPLATVDSYLISGPCDEVTRTAEVQFDSLNGLPFILPSVPNGLRAALDSVAKARHLTIAPVIEADSLPLQKLLVATDGLYTVLPLHAVWHEVSEQRLVAARIVDPPFQRTVSMALSRSKGPGRAVSAAASEIARIATRLAAQGMWRDRRVTSLAAPQTT